MKVLPTARILLVDSQADRRASTRSALTAFGVGAILEADCLNALPEPDADILVVQSDDPEHVPENPFRNGGKLPAILIADVPSALLGRTASRAGYDAALDMPLAPRLLYRRIGSVLQRARRIGRPGVPPAAVETASVVPPVAPVLPVIREEPGFASVSAG